MNGSRRLIARVAQKRIILDARSTPLSTTDEMTDRECEITAATIFIMRRHYRKQNDIFITNRFCILILTLTILTNNDNFV
jgi:hypothetical protein